MHQDRIEYITFAQSVAITAMPLVIKSIWDGVELSARPTEYVSLHGRQ